MTVAPWSGYQEEVAAFFREVGLEAETDVTLQGARTSHDIDVVVRGEHVGFSILWIVECKLWRTRISKAEVLLLRQVVVDVGADRGVLSAEAGFQSGALEAASLTNVQLSSLATLRGTAGHAILMARLRDLELRVLEGKRRYWELSKDTRIRFGLRPDFLEPGMSADLILAAGQYALHEAFLGRFPNDQYDLTYREVLSGVDSVEALERFLTTEVARIENLLRAAEQSEGG